MNTRQPTAQTSASSFSRDGTKIPAEPTLIDQKPHVCPSMHLSAHHWMRREPLDTTLARLSRLGYSSIQLTGEPELYDVETTKAALTKYGIRCHGAVTLMFGNRNLIGPSLSQRRETIAYTKSVVKLAADLGGRMVCVIPSTVGARIPTATPVQEWKWAVEGLKEICSFAVTLGIRIGIEPQNRFETYFLNRIDQALALAEAVGFDCGVVFDPCHLAIDEKDMHAALRSCGPRLVDFHVAENNRQAPGDGSFDWPRLISILKEIEYQGALTFEAMPKQDRISLAIGGLEGSESPEDNNDLPIDDEKTSQLALHGAGVMSERLYTNLLARTVQILSPLLVETV